MINCALTKRAIPLDLEQIEKSPTRLRWALMAFFPILLFILTLFLGRCTVSPDQVLYILGRNLFNLPLEKFWTDTAEIVVMRVRLPRAIMAALGLPKLPEPADVADALAIALAAAYDLGRRPCAERPV